MARNRVATDHMRDAEKKAKTDSDKVLKRCMIKVSLFVFLKICFYCTVFDVVYIDFDLSFFDIDISFQCSKIRRSLKIDFQRIGDRVQKSQFLDLESSYVDFGVRNSTQIQK